MLATRIDQNSAMRINEAAKAAQAGKGAK